MLTKAQVRTLVREYLDDPSSQRWSDVSLDLAIQLVLDDLWGDILDAAPYLTSQYQQIASLHSPGYIDLRLTSQGGDLSQRFYRLQQLVADGKHFFAKDQRDYLLTASTNTNDTTTVRGDVEQRGSYQFLGDQLWVHPLGDVGTFVEIRYSFKPTAFTQLTNGSSVPFPEGHEHSLILLSAAHAMIKGNVEEAGQLFKAGEDARQRLLNAIKRQYHGMTVPFTGTTAIEFGGT